MPYLQKITLSLLLISLGCKPKETSNQSQSIQNTTDDKQYAVDAGLYVDASPTTKKGELTPDSLKKGDFLFSGDEYINRVGEVYDQALHKKLSPQGFFFIKIKPVIDQNGVANLPESFQIISGNLEPFPGGCENLKTSIPDKFKNNAKFSPMKSALISMIDDKENAIAPKNFTLCLTNEIENEDGENGNEISILAIKPSSEFEIDVKIGWQWDDPTSIFQIQVKGLQGVPSDKIPTAEYTWPVENPKITDKFGRRKRPCPKCSEYHKGIDIGLKEDTKLRASNTGMISTVWHECGGNIIDIKGESTKPKTHSRYLHLKVITKAAGSFVTPKDIVAHSGTTGNCTTGPHLHFEILNDHGTQVDPLNYLK